MRAVGSRMRTLSASLSLLAHRCAFLPLDEVRQAVWVWLWQSRSSRRWVEGFGWSRKLSRGTRSSSLSLWRERSLGRMVDSQPMETRTMCAKILLVEDDLVNMKLLQMCLRKEGYTFVEAHDGPGALNTAIKERPDLIIMDIRLPGMDGLEVTRRLRQMQPFSHTPIIIVTAYAVE